jgi:hypothetical protein
MYKFCTKVAVNLAVRDVYEENTYKVAVTSPRIAAEEIESLGWTFTERADADTVEDWVTDIYKNDQLPDVALHMSWNGWYGQVEVCACRLK